MSAKAKNTGEGGKVKRRKHENRKEAQSAQCIPGLEYSWASIRFGILQARAQKEDKV